MTANISFFPVGNGDMTLIRLADGSQTRHPTTILLDCNIRNAADDPNDSTRDVAKDLRARIGRDPKGRPFVDVFAWSHPDQDHCNGISDHFYLGDPAFYPDDRKPDNEKRILIRELWSSPMVFRRHCKKYPLCQDAKDLNSEAVRRANLNKSKRLSEVGDGNRILILGEDEDGKTKGLNDVLVTVDSEFNRVNGNYSSCFRARLLAPMPKCDDETEDELSKNHSSVILNMSIAADPNGATWINFLSGGDAEVSIWERLYDKHRLNMSVLEYNLMQTPHHCSWHSLSWESWKDTKGKAKPSAEALAALSRAKRGAFIVSSSDPILNDFNDPPCYGAMQVYKQITIDNGGAFYCTGEYPKAGSELPLEIEITAKGVQLKTTAGSLLKPLAATAGLQFPNHAAMPNKSVGFA